MAKQQKESFKQKIQNWLGGRSNRPNLSDSIQQHSKPGVPSFICTADILRDIGPESPTHVRLRKLKDISDVVKEKYLEDNAIEALWTAVSDLLHPQAQTECRKTILYFMKCLIMGQYGKLGMMRSLFFRIIQNHNVFEDLQLRLEVFRRLSDCGRDLTYFEEETGSFLVEWMPDVISYGRSLDFLALLVNVIKFNASFLDDDIVTDLIRHTCSVCNHTVDESDMKISLDVFDTVVCYSSLPVAALYHFTTTLCKTVSVPSLCQTSWKLMRKLFGTHLGHSAIYTLCCIMEDNYNMQDVILLRGAVFFIGMSLWGSDRVTSLKQTYSSVLPSFLTSLSANHVMVSFEVVLSVQRLVEKYGKDLHMNVWDNILDIVDALYLFVEQNAEAREAILCRLNEVVTATEELYENTLYNGDVDRLFNIVDEFSNLRPVSSVLLLVTYKALSVYPTRDGWIENLQKIMHKHFREEVRTRIRVEALKVLSSVLTATSHLYECDLVESIVLPELKNISDDCDEEVRTAGVQLLVDLTSDCQSHYCFDLLTIIEKVAFLSMASSKPVLTTPTDFDEQYGGEFENRFNDVKTAVKGLTKIFKDKIYILPSMVAIEAYMKLVNIAQTHYANDYYSDTAVDIRRMVFECLLSVRADDLYRIGVPDKTDKLHYSPYLLCDYSDSMQQYKLSGTVSPPPSMNMSVSALPGCKISVLSFADAFKSIVLCLTKERDWLVLQSVLIALPTLLQNKSLVLGSNCNVKGLCERLCNMVNTGKDVVQIIHKIPERLTVSELNANIFPVLAVLSSYHAQLDGIKYELIQSLETGLRSRHPRQCVCALTMCMIEMQAPFQKDMCKILLKLSQIPATVTNAIPMLEFLSILIRFPKLYAGFVEDQFMSIFAVALPYTNPIKFPDYCVMLAHHVIAVWFIKCRLTFRRDFVRFITKGLRSNSMLAGDDLCLSYPHSSQQQTGARNMARSRASSRRGSRPVILSSGLVAEGNMKPKEELQKLQIELIETSIDMMAKYTFSSLSVTPKRTPLAEFLLAGGQAITWLLGNKLITITTNGSGPFKVKGHGLCEKCSGLIRRSSPDSVASTSSAETSARLVKPEATVNPGQTLLNSAARNYLDSIHESRGTHSIADGSLTVDDIDGAITMTTTVNPTKPDLEEGDCKTTIPTQLSIDSSDASNRPVNNLSALYECNCMCTGWAEILVRRPTGNMSWMMRIQNQLNNNPSSKEMPIENLIALLPTCDDTVGLNTLARQSSVDSNTKIEMCDDIISDEDEQERKWNSPLKTENYPCSGCYTGNTTIYEKSEGYSGETEGETETVIGLQRSRSLPDLVSHLPLLQIPDKKPQHDFTKSADYAGPGGNVSDKTLFGNAQLDRCLHKCHSTDSIDTKPYSSNEHFAVSLQTSTDDNQPPIQSQTHDKWHAYSDSELKVSTDEPSHRSPTEISPVRTVSPRRASAFSNDGQSKTGSPECDDEMTPLPSTGRKDSFNVPSEFRVRGHTVSVMTPTETARKEGELRKKRNSTLKDLRSSVNPRFVFLQLYHSAVFGTSEERPVLLPNNQIIERALKVLDRIPPYQTHKVGVVYVGPGQEKDEAAILSNEYGSCRYVNFMKGLGQLVCLQNISPDQIYTGGLDQNGADGKFAYCWQDDISQVIFHVATLMPNKDTDPGCSSKKRHIGNDFVTIVYNDSGTSYLQGTIKGQFNFVEVLIKPLDRECNLVTLRSKDVLQETISHFSTQIVSDDNLAVLVSQLALHADLASQVHQSQAGPCTTYTSNWLERLRQIKRLRHKIQHKFHTETSKSSPCHNNPVAEDFTDFV